MHAAMHWGLLLSPPMRGAENMALDEALLGRARANGARGTQEGVVRVYSWERPTLSLGRHQPARGAYDVEGAAARGIDIVRRPTGGRALLHNREITYSVSAPLVAGQTLRGAYEAINALLLETLHALGVRAAAATPATREAAPSLAPCFEHPSAGELVHEGRKLVGSAQYREGSAYLQHGSILVHDDQPIIAQLSREPLVDVPPAATIFEAIGRELDAREFADAFFAAVRRSASSCDDWTVDEETAARMRTALTRYEDDAWTWRR